MVAFPERYCTFHSVRYLDPLSAAMGANAGQDAMIKELPLTAKVPSMLTFLSVYCFFPYFH